MLVGAGKNKIKLQTIPMNNGMFAHIHKFHSDSDNAP